MQFKMYISISLYIFLCFISNAEAKRSMRIIPSDLNTENKTTSFTYILHDYLEHPTHTWSQEIENLEKFWTNVAVMNWTDFYLPNYTTTASQPNIFEAAEAFKDLIISQTKKKTVKELRFIAHGLGAHIAGVTAELLRPRRTVTEIVALDPAGYLFEPANKTYRLSKDNAERVVVFHTNDGKYGFNGTLGRWNIHASDVKFSCEKPVTYEIPERNTNDRDFCRHDGAAYLYVQYFYNRALQLCDGTKTKCRRPISDYTERLSGEFELIKVHQYYIIYHGYQENSQAGWCKQLEKIFKTRGATVKLIDWSRNAKETYYETVKNLEKIMVKSLEKWPFRNIHKPLEIYVIGYDLGAQIAASAIRQYKKITGKMVTSFIALDPSGYLFENEHADIHAAVNDSEHVSVYHTNERKYGFGREIRGWNFYTRNLQLSCSKPLERYSIPKPFLTNTDFCKHTQVVQVFLDVQHDLLDVEYENGHYELKWYSDPSGK